MRWFDPITERWIDPPAVSRPPLTYADQQLIAANLHQDQQRKARADGIWQAIVASATACHVSDAQSQEGEGE